jgi:hypothetical protein
MERILKNWGPVIVILVTNVIRLSRRNRVMRYIIQIDIVYVCIFGMFVLFYKERQDHDVTYILCGVTSEKAVF